MELGHQRGFDLLDSGVGTSLGCSDFGLHCFDFRLHGGGDGLDGAVQRFVEVLPCDGLVRVFHGA